MHMGFTVLDGLQEITIYLSDKIQTVGLFCLLFKIKHDLENHTFACVSGYTLRTGHTAFHSTEGTDLCRCK